MLKLLSRTALIFMFHGMILPQETVLAQDIFDEIAQTHVDHIEEFIDRFNFAEGSQFYNFTKNNYPEHNIDRSIVIQSLFNKRLNRTDQITQQQFIKAVTNQNRPVTLEIYDALWYACVPASVTVDQKKINIKVSLEIQLNVDYSIEWTVIGVQSDALNKSSEPKEHYISASSHASYFPELKAALASPEIFKTIVSDSQKKNNPISYLDLIENKKVTNVKIENGIQYHFLQISGWIMVVEYAPQDKSLNTGWLISEVIEVETFLEKRVYQWKEIGIFSLN